ncbi:hypothetical protein 162276058 [Organic Lake phycodnavirus 2]|nr:hypothetical protein 162276058 [Organic Lake phycodnavirus 2]
MDDILNPYNEKNVLIKEEDIESILRTFDIYHKVVDMNLWNRAFVNSSYINNPI